MDTLEERIINKLETANTSLWQNLLSLNALLATIFITIASFSDLHTISKWIVYLGFLCSSAICIYLVANFLGMQRIYARRLRKIMEPQRSDKKIVEEDTAAEQLVSTLSERVERISIVGSFVGWILILVVVFLRLMMNY